MCEVDHTSDIKAMIEIMLDELGPVEGHAVMMDIRLYLKQRLNENFDKVRVLSAKKNEADRIAKGTREWWTHMRHCYGLNYDFHEGPGRPTDRYGCKYGEDEKCPAALYEDPWAAYVAAEEAEKSG